MPSIQYNGVAPIHETAITGKQQKWFPGQIQQVSDADAALLKASGLGFADEKVAPGDLTPATVAALQAVVSGDWNLTPLRSDLESGRSSVLALIGDSTGNETWEHLALTAQAIADQYPTLRVEYQTWDHTAQDWAQQTPFAAGSSGRLGLVGGAACLPVDEIGDWTGADLDFRVLCSHPTWTSYGSDVTLFSRYGSGGARSFRLMVSTSGANTVIKLGWTADLSTEITASASGFAIAAGEEIWLRATLDADNGGGGYTVTFYSSTDGSTWTQRGQTVTAAGTTTVAKAAYQYEVGSRGNGSASFPGSVHRVEMRDGINGPNMLPINIDAWREIQSGTAAVWTGSQTLYVVNGSWSGQSISYFNDATRRPKITPRMSRGAMILSDAHNEAQTLTRAAVADWFDYVAGRVDCPIYWTNQNPRGTGVGATRINLQRELVGQMAARAARRGWPIIDVYRAFFTSNDMAALINADQIHPSAEGQAVWSRVELAALGWPY